MLKIIPTSLLLLTIASTSTLAGENKAFNSAVSNLDTTEKELKTSGTTADMKYYAKVFKTSLIKLKKLTIPPTQTEKEQQAAQKDIQTLEKAADDLAHAIKSNREIEAKKIISQIDSSLLDLHKQLAPHKVDKASKQNIQASLKELSAATSQFMKASDLEQEQESKKMLETIDRMHKELHEKLDKQQAN